MLYDDSSIEVSRPQQQISSRPVRTKGTQFLKNKSQDLKDYHDITDG